MSGFSSGGGGGGSNPFGSEIDLSEMQTIADQRLVGNVSGGTAVPSALTAAETRTMLGLVVGTDVQAYNSDLAAIAGITPSDGDLIYRSSGAWTRLGVGTDTHVLTMSSGAPTWAAASGGGTPGGSAGQLQYYSFDGPTFAGNPHTYIDTQGNLSLEGLYKLSTGTFGVYGYAPISGNGGNVSFIGGISNDGTGGNCLLWGGDGFTGGYAEIAGGTAYDGSGGGVNIKGRAAVDGGGGGGNGGAVAITTGKGTDTFTGGSFSVVCGAGTSGDVNGGNVTFSAAAGRGAGTGGVIVLSAGNGGATADGGAVTITSGNGGSTSGEPGLFQIVAGSGGGSGSGANLELYSGSGAGTNKSAGALVLTTGNGTGSGIGGTFQLIAGDSSGSGHGGNVEMTAGVSASGTHGKFTRTTNATVRETLDGAGAFRWHAYGAGTLTTDGSGNVAATSDARKKDVVDNFLRGLDAICQLQPKNYRWKPDSGMESEGVYTGFIAQDVKEIIPEAVGQGTDGFYTLQDRPLLATLVNAIRELKQEVDALRAQLNT